MDTYKATNTLNGKFYIGSSNNFERRKNEHLQSKESYPFQNALRKNPDAFEWEVQSDDYDEPILEQALLDMWFGCEQCYNLNQHAEHPPDSTGKIQWKNELTQEQRLCFEKPEGEGWEQGMLQKTKEKYSEAKSGENNPRFGIPHTKEAKKKISEAMSGENHPLFGKFGASNPSSKAIIAIKPDGTKLHFGGGNEAARELGIDQRHLSGRYLNTGKSPTKGKFKGWRFIFKNPEVT
jgi:group I intron endonuclease